MFSFALQLYITASDRSPDPATVRSVTATVTVLVERNIAPVITDKNGYLKTISEGATLDTEVFLIRATDANPADSMNGQLTYEIIDEDASRKFQIDSVGKVTPRVTLKNVDSLIWQFTVRVSDRGIPPLYDEARVTVNIQRVGGPIFNPSNYTFNKDENMAVNDILLTFKAIDETPDGPLVYVIRGDGLAPSMFRIEQIGDSATIRLNRSFITDDNKTPQYTLRVHAYRERDPNVYAEAIIKVNVNRNPSGPTFDHGDLVFNIEENIPLKTVFGDVNAADPDLGSNGEIIYEISESNLSPSYLQQYFMVNPVNGNLSVIADLVADSNTIQYVMTVIAKDKGVPRKEAYVKVTVNVQRNPNPPIFRGTPYRVSVNENEPPGHSVITVTAVDDDNDPVIYAIKDEPPASLYFDINPTTGLITTKAILYDDTVTSYTITVFARDNTPASRTSDVTVIVDIIRNPNAPVFTQARWNRTISEYDEIGTRVLAVTATDSDNQNSNSGILRYKLGRVQPPNANQFFSVSSTVGEIQVARSLIRTTPVPLSVELEVLAYDLSVQPKTATTTVTIGIVRNQFAPVFRNGSSVETTAFERATAGEVIANLTADDPDRNVPLNADTPNADVQYSLKGDSNTFARFFEIRQNGQLIVSQQLYLPTLQDDFIYVSKLHTIYSFRANFSFIMR